jgi:hypothetical protein
MGSVIAAEPQLLSVVPESLLLTAWKAMIGPANDILNVITTLIEDATASVDKSDVRSWILRASAPS